MRLRNATSAAIPVRRARRGEALEAEQRAAGVYVVQLHGITAQ